MSTPLRFTATLSLALLGYMATFVAYHTYAHTLDGGVGWGLFVGVVILLLGLE